MSRSGDWYIRTYPNGDDDDSDYDVWRSEEYMMNEAIEYIETSWGIFGNFEDRGFWGDIWHASYHILNGLEVQVVIDSNDKAFVSTGTPGYVDFLRIDPAKMEGMKLPIKCWIHTHPFGAAYFSGTDWRTVNTWRPLMQKAYVLGGNHHRGHYGAWVQEDPDTLTVFDNYKEMRKQQQYRSEEE